MRISRRHARGRSTGKPGMLVMLTVAAASVAVPAAVLAASVHSPAGKDAAPTPRPAWALHLRHLSHGRPGAIMKPQIGSATWSVTYPVQLPHGYQTPTGMAADILGDGVWLFAQGGTPASPLDTVFYWSNTTAKLDAYQLAATDPTLQGGAQTPIAVDADGVAWIGDNKTLISVNRQTGTISTFDLPDVSTATPGSGLPVPPPGADAQDFTDIDALAIAPDGSIVVARQFATELEIFDPSTQQASSLPLPEGTSLAGLGEDVASGLGGDIAAVLYAGQGIHELGQYSSGQWTVSQEPCPAYAVSMTGTAIAVTGPDCVAVGTVPGGTGPATMTVQPGSSAYGSESQACAVPLTTGTVATCSPGGIALAEPGSASATRLGLGRIVSAIPASGQAEGAGAELVALPVTPGSMSAGTNGALWFVPAQGGTSIGLLSPA